MTRPLRDFVLRRADALVAVSEHTARIAGEISKRKVELVLPGIEGNLVEISEPRTKDGLDGPICVLSIGRFVERKGHLRLVEAVRLARNVGIDLRLVIAGGDGPEREAIEQVAEDPQSWWLTVHVNIAAGELDRLYRASDIFALLCRDIDSEFEGFGLVLVEAAAYGLPVIAGVSGGSSDAVLVGENCLHVESVDEAVVALKRLALNSELRRSMGKKGQNFARYFTCDKWAERLNAVEQSLNRAPFVRSRRSYFYPHESELSAGQSGDAEKQPI
jgi:phosphatidylinositol alpha-1,6-mannosyltransferase